MEIVYCDECEKEATHWVENLDEYFDSSYCSEHAPEGAKKL